MAVSSLVGPAQGDQMDRSPTLWVGKKRITSARFPLGDQFQGCDSNPLFSYGSGFNIGKKGVG